MQTLGQVARTLKRLYNSNSLNLLLVFASRYINMAKQFQFLIESFSKFG